MFLLTYAQDKNLKNVSDSDIFKFGERRALLFIVDLIIDYRDLISEHDLVNLVYNFIVLYELFYFVWGRKVTLTNIFFYNKLKIKKIIFFSFLHKEFRFSTISGYINTFMVQRNLLKIFSKIHSLSVNLNYSSIESNTISFYYKNLLDYFFCFRPDLLFWYKRAFISCRILLNLGPKFSPARGNFDLLVFLNSISLNYNEIKDL